MKIVIAILFLIYMIWFIQENFTNFGYERYKESVNKDLVVYVINLDEATNRWEETKKMLTEYGFNNVKRVSAVNGRKAKTKWDIPEYQGLPCLSLDNPEKHVTHVACYLSHLKALELFLQSDEKWVLILEDDCFFRKKKKTTMRIINNIMKKGVFGWLTGGTAESLLMNRDFAKYIYGMLNQQSDFTKNFKNKYNKDCLYDWALNEATKFVKYNHETKFSGQRENDASYITGKIESKNILNNIHDFLSSVSWY